MIGFLWHNLWPNMFAPSVWAIAAIIVSHFRLRAYMKKHHQELEKHKQLLLRLLAHHIKLLRTLSNENPEHPGN